MSHLTEEMDNPKPIILLLGEIVLAHKEWDALRAIAELRQVSEGSRDQFLRDLKNGVYDGVVAISRTWDSTEITGRFDPTLVDLLPKTLKSISHNGAGYDSIDATACATRGISVSNTPGAVDASTASVAIWLMLGALRRAHIPYMATRTGNWRGRMQLTHDPENKMLGILGMGGIGTAVAKRAAAFGMSIQYHNRRELGKDKNTVGAKYVTFEKLLRTSDVISVHLPLNEGTRGMIGKKEFSIMKDDVVIVNTARGPILDEAALVDALESGKVWGAGLDVYEYEPAIPEGLLRNDHCVLMPHVGTASFETQRKMEELVIKNLRSVITEGTLLTPVSESKVLMMNGVEENGGERTTVVAEEFAVPVITANDMEGKIRNEAQPLIEEKGDIGREAIDDVIGSPAMAINEVKKDGSNSNVPVINGINVDSLWETPKTPLKKAQTNWLELSPPLKPMDKDSLLTKESSETNGVEAMLESPDDESPRGKPNDRIGGMGS